MHRNLLTHRCRRSACSLMIRGEAVNRIIRAFRGAKHSSPVLFDFICFKDILLNFFSFYADLQDVVYAYGYVRFYVSVC